MRQPQSTQVSRKFKIKGGICSCVVAAILPSRMVVNIVPPDYVIVKGAGHDFLMSGRPINHFQKQGKIHNSKESPHKNAEMKKTGLLATFILGGAL